MATLSLSAHVRSTTEKDGVVLLDINDDAMFALNPIGSYVWTKLALGITVDQIITDLGEDTGESRAVIEPDVLNFINELSVQGILEKAKPLVATERYLFRLAMLRLLSFDLLVLQSKLMRQRPFRNVHKMVQRWPVSSLGKKYASLESVCEAVERASNWYPKTVLCLQRSAVTACLLRDQGIFAQMVIGARKVPFSAHAWVEVDGRIVNDKSTIGQRYSVMERC